MHSRRRGVPFLAVAAAFTLGSAAPVGAAESAATHDVTIESFQFAPATVNAAVGDSVRWTNLDGVAHNVSGGPLFSGNFSSGAYVHEFADPGVYSYICTLHSGMSGEVVVAAVPDAIVPEVGLPAALGLTALAVTAVALATRRRRDATRSTSA